MIAIFFFVLFHPFGSSIQADETNRSVADVVRDGQSVDNEDEDIVAPTQQEPDVGNNNLFIEEEIGLGAKDENYVLTLFKMLLALAVVIAIIVFLLRFIGKKSQSYHSSRTLQNIGGVPLGANKSVQLIKVGSHVLVVGVGDSIQLLKEIRDESEVKQIIEQQTLQTDSEQIPFVSRFFGRSKDSTLPNEVTENKSFKNLLEKQLMDVKESQKKIYAAIKEKDQ